MIVWRGYVTGYEEQIVVNKNGDYFYPGWFRCIGGRLANGLWPI